MHRIIFCIFVFTFALLTKGFAQDVPPAVGFTVDQVSYTKLDGEGSLPLYLTYPVTYPVNVTLNFSTGTTAIITFEPGNITQTYLFPVEDYSSISNFSVTIQSPTNNATVANISVINVSVQYSSIVFLSGEITVTTPQQYAANVTLNWASDQDISVTFTVTTPGNVALSDFGFILFGSTSVTVPAGETWVPIVFTYGPQFTASYQLPNLTISIIEVSNAEIGSGLQECLVMLPSPSIQIQQTTMWTLSNIGFVSITYLLEPTLWEGSILTYVLYDSVELSNATLSTSAVPALQSQPNILIPIVTPDVPLPDRWWLITIYDLELYQLSSYPSVNVTIVDEVVFLGNSTIEATADGELILYFLLLYPSTVNVSAKYTISDAMGVLNTSYVTFPEGVQSVTVEALLPPNNQTSALSYAIVIENALNSTIR